MSNPAAKPSRPAVFAACACATAGIALFQFCGSAAKGYVSTNSLFWWWVSQWIDPIADSQHGWLILALSGWLFWRNLRVEEASSTPDAVWPAGWVMLVALAFHLVGHTAQQARVSIVALLLFAWGVLRLAGGRRWGGAAIFPIAFLVFAIPVNVLDTVGFWLRVWVVDASAAIARATGIGVLRSGTQLLAADGSYNYDVAAACSGIRSLTAMAALSLLVGYLSFKVWWQRGLLLVLCFPLVYLGNVARILAIIFAAEAGGAKWGNVAHEIMGYGVFVIVLGGVLAAATLLQRWHPETAPAKPASARAEETSDTTAQTSGRANAPRLRRTSAVMLAAIVATLTIGEIVFLRHLEQSPARGKAGVLLAADGINPVELPAFLGADWIGRRAEVSAVEREILPKDTGYSRKVYVDLSDARRQVFVSIVLNGRDRTSIHRPELCLVGQGWTIQGTTLHQFARPNRSPGTFPATLLRVRREVQTRQGRESAQHLVAYWFMGGDLILPSHWQLFLRDAWNRVARGRADRWAYVLMQTDAGDGEALALARLQRVLDAVMPVFAPQATAKEQP